MTTQYTSILKLALPVQGELSGTWGDVVNDNITSMVEQAIAGRAVIDSWTANAHTLTTANGVTSESRCAMLEFTDSGTQLTGAGSVVCPTLSKIYIAKNASGQNVTLKTSGGTGILVPSGRTMFLFCDGTNVVEAVTSTTSLQLGTSTTVTAVLDEDNMASNSAVSLATQQSIKAYVDAQVATSDTLAEVLANGNTTGGTDVSVSTDDKVQFRDAAIYINSSADGQLDIVADTEIQIAATTIDVNGILDVSGNIVAGGTVDGRDVATDGTKLDGIEASADVTDTTNVTAAGALMDSEVTNLAQVKAFDSSDYATAAQGTLATNALPKSGGAMTGAITTNSTFDGVDIATRDGVLTTTTTTANAALPKAGGTMSGDIDCDGNKVLFSNVYSTLGDLPSATDNHGMFAHVHATGKGYFAHAGSWVALANDTEKLNLTGGTMSGEIAMGTSKITGAGNPTAAQDLATKAYVDANSGGAGGAETLQETLVIGNTVTTDTKIQFRDTGLYINSSADGQLDIVADTEVQIAATTVDVNGILDVSGNIVAGGTVDGRDVATDGTKLDGIEASADVTDATNVTAAGALMDSELTAIASVKALNQGVATTDSPTFTNLTLSGTDSVKVPSGTTAQRNGSPANGMFRYNSTTAEFEGYQDSAWGSIGGGTSDITLSQFTGDGSDTTFTLSGLAAENNTFVFIDGVYQSKSNYSVSTADPAVVTFSTAPPNTTAIEVMVAAISVSNIGTPSDNTVSTAKIVDGAVTPAKIASGDFNFAKNDQTNGSTLSITNSFNGGGWDAGDILGSLNFKTDDTSTTQPIRGQIKVFEDSASGATYPNSNAMSFSTGLNNDLTERLRITSAGVVEFKAGITEDAVTLTGTSTTIDLATATNFVHDLTGATTYTFSNPATTGNATAFTLKIIQDSTARAVTWPASVDWAGGTAPTLTATNNGVDVFVFYTIDGGTTYYGFTAGQAMA